MSLASMERQASVLSEENDDPLPDGQLLQRYVAIHDESAFAALVERYGGLVFGVCERVLQHSQDAEDAFQATFLVLSRRAATLDGRGPLGNWLYAVAYRTAIKARQRAARRRSRELQVLNMSTEVSHDEEQQQWSDLRPLIDEELNQLPAKYRAPLVLCYLEGKTQQQAARELGWPTGSMSRRMNRARDLLQERLARRGLAMSTGFLFMLIAKKASAAIVSPALAGMTAQTALAFGAGSAGLTRLSGQIVSLAEEVLRTTSKAPGKLAKILTTLALVFLIIAMSGILAYEVAGYLRQGTLWDCVTPAKTDLQR